MMNLPQANAIPTGRVARRRHETRGRLLKAAYEVMGEAGVDAAKIKDITDKADIGFGTFYNYFETKDELAGQVLDCLINDIAHRNIVATKGIRQKDPASVMPVSIRLWIREAAREPMWQWWALRPDLLADRMREGFGAYGMRDIHDGIVSGHFTIRHDDVPAMWSLAIWMMVGGVHDIVVGQRPLTHGDLVVSAIIRMLGIDAERADELSNGSLPKYPPPDMDWTFQLLRDKA